MIHYWECDRCTHTWTTSCFSSMMTKPEEKERNHRQLSSNLCWDCFEQLEKGEIAGLELFDFVFHLEEKLSRYGGRHYGDYVFESKYSGMCHEYIGNTYKSDGSIDKKGNFESGMTAEEKQLANITSDVKYVYQDLIKQQRTTKRIELDEFQKTAGVRFFVPRPRPENFEGDPPGKVRFTALFGLDMKTGSIIAPMIIAEDGSRK